jgi:RimJ/RimL family protein N-acetyltransferase
MSISPSPVRAELIRDGLYCLARFQPGKAGLVASWAPTAHDLFWLAPKTFPPLTAAKVIAWSGEDASPMLFYRDPETEPVGYVELNPMPGERDHLWMGHCVINSERRGEGLGRIMVALLLRLSFELRRAQRVSLVVFPGNVSAIHCYRACAFEDAGTQTKYFYPTNRQHTMLQMSITRSRWRALHARSTKS